MEPTTYEEWKYCITEICGIPLTLKFITTRIAALSDKQDYHTQAFIKIWGHEHLQRVTDWFKQAEKECSQSHETLIS